MNSGDETSALRPDPRYWRMNDAEAWMMSRSRMACSEREEERLLACYSQRLWEYLIAEDMPDGKPRPWYRWKGEWILAHRAAARR